MAAILANRCTVAAFLVRAYLFVLHSPLHWRGGTVPVFGVLTRVLQGYFGMRAGGQVAAIIQHSQVCTVFFEHYGFFLVLVRIQVGPPFATL